MSCLIDEFIYFSFIVISNKFGLIFTIFSCVFCLSTICLPRAALTNYYKLQKTEIYFLTVLEVRSLKSRCWHGWVPYRNSRGDSIPCLIQLLVATGIPRLVAASLPSCLCLHMTINSSPCVPLDSYHWV